MEIRIQKSSHPTLLVNLMRPKSLATTVRRDTATKDQMTALMVDPWFWSPLAGGIIVAYEPTLGSYKIFKEARGDVEAGRKTAIFRQGGP